MLQDHEIKDKILEDLAKNTDTKKFRSPNLFADEISISVERSYSLFEQIRKDSRCSRGYYSDQYYRNEDTIRFLKEGGYTKKYEDEKQKENMQSEKLNLEIEKLRNEFFDYPVVKQRAKWSFILAITSVIISFILVSQKIFCNPH